MARAGFYLYGAQGKVGNLVARRNASGGTTLSERKFTIANPQTTRQMAQRIILATVAAAAKFMTNLIDHSFEGISVGAKSKQMFRSLNMKQLRKLAARDYAEGLYGADANAFMTTKNVNALVPNRYIISKGSLSAPAPTVSRNASGLLIVTFPYLNIEVSGDTQKFITLGDALKAMFNITTDGEQITLVIIQQTGDGETLQFVYGDDATSPGEIIGYKSMLAQRLCIPLGTNLDTPIAVTDANGENPTFDNVITAVYNAFATSAKTNSTLNGIVKAYLEAQSLTTTIEDGVMEVNLNSNPMVLKDYYESETDSPKGYPFAAGIIRSRYDDAGNWAYSDSVMEIAKPQEGGEYNFGLSWAYAVPAWLSGSQTADSGLYLDSGTDDSQIGESFA